MYPYGIMFHYFHNHSTIKETQGSISGEKFEQIIENTKKTNNLLSAEDFLIKALKGKLADRDICLTFDDGLSSQYEVAFPILKSHGLTAFWFVYTSVQIKGNYEKLEVYRVFRNSFDSMDAFYDAFYRELSCGAYERARAGWESDKGKSYKSEATYYTENDRRFRYVRDYMLSSDSYDEIIKRMMKQKGFRIEEECGGIWIDANELKQLRSEGNIIGLHSHTHPTVMSKLSYSEQSKEYSTCKSILTELLPETEICTASYPCDYYNGDTLRIMHSLGIKIGFIAHMEKCNNPLLIARRDCAEY